MTRKACRIHAEGNLTNRLPADAALRLHLAQARHTLEEADRLLAALEAPPPARPQREMDTPAEAPPPPISSASAACGCGPSP